MPVWGGGQTVVPLEAWSLFAAHLGPLKARRCPNRKGTKQGRGDTMSGTPRLTRKKPHLYLESRAGVKRAGMDRVG